MSSGGLFANAPAAERLESHNSRQTVAAQIAKAPTKAHRQAIWMHVPPGWRDLVGYNVALILGTTIGTMPKLVDRRAALDQVPDELRPLVEREVARVFLKGSRAQ